MFLSFVSFDNQKQKTNPVKLLLCKSLTSWSSKHSGYLPTHKLFHLWGLKVYDYRIFRNVIQSPVGKTLL